jgi:hypothetical protein
MSALAYPIGRFDLKAPFSIADRLTAIDDIATLPERLRNEVSKFSDSQLDTPYRPGGWTVRQVVHHIPDSHLNAYTRFKLALTENEPTIKPYDQAAWADLADSQLPVEPSLQLLAALHTRWATLLQSLTEAQWERRLFHPDLGTVVLHPYVGLYAWHGRHHLAHVEQALANVSSQHI